MKFHEASDAIEDAKCTERHAKRMRKELSRLLKWELQNSDIPSHVLQAFKAELRRFNVHTGLWKTRD